MKKNKRTILAHAVSALLAVSLMIGAAALSPASAGSYNGFGYSIENGEVTITGFSGSGDVTIPSAIDGNPVTAIGEKAFRNNKSLTSVKIPDSVRTIEYEAFASCSSLKSVAFGSRLKKIGMLAFKLCESLSEVILPDSVEFLDMGAFTDCYALKTVKFGKKVSSVGEVAFFGCYELKGITVDEENESFISIDGILYSKDLTEIVWCPTSKTEISLPESVTIIGPNAFSECADIKNLNIPGNVTEIGNSAYSGCNTITHLIIPDSVTKVGMGAFAYITTLKSVTFGSGLNYIPGVLFEGCVSLTSITIPEGMTEIGKRAFYNCTSLKTIMIPSSVTKMDKMIFDNCISLTDIYYGGTQSVWNEISQNANVPSNTRVHFGANSIDKPSIIFTDVKASEYYADAVSWAVENGITSGTSKTTFSPNNGCTRGQVVTFLWRAAGSPEPKSGNNPFADVKTDDYYYKAVLWAVEKNITKGTSDTKFSPSDVCTRGQIVTFLWRAAGEPEPAEKNNPFSDVNESDFFYKAVLWAVENEISKGTSSSKFSPKDTCTRGQIVTFLWRS